MYSSLIYPTISKTWVIFHQWRDSEIFSGLGQADCDKNASKAPSAPNREHTAGAGWMMGCHQGSLVHGGWSFIIIFILGENIRTSNHSWTINHIWIINQRAPLWTALWIIHQEPHVNHSSSWITLMDMTLCDVGFTCIHHLPPIESWWSNHINNSIGNGLAFPNNFVGRPFWISKNENVCGTVFGVLNSVEVLIQWPTMLLDYWFQDGGFYILPSVNVFHVAAKNPWPIAAHCLEQLGHVCSNGNEAGPWMSMGGGLNSSSLTKTTVETLLDATSTSLYGTPKNADKQSYNDIVTPKNTYRIEIR